MWEFCTFVLQFDNFPGQEKWNDERMQSESSRRRRNDQFIDSQKLIFWWIFVTSCYVLNKIVILSEISIPEWSETGPGPRGIVVMTRRAYCLSSVRVIRWQGRASWRNRPCAPRGQKWIKNVIFEQCLETCVISVHSKNTSTAEIQIIMKNLQF